jgi:hypothetical protein
MGEAPMLDRWRRGVGRLTVWQTKESNVIFFVFYSVMMGFDRGVAR